jgi:hypothetical protein
LGVEAISRLSCFTDAETARNAAAKLAYFSEALVGGPSGVIDAE